MSAWPRWSQQGEAVALAKYVRPDDVAALVRLPGPAGGSRIAQARAVYEALAAAEITYAYEAPGDDPARQVIREPAEILWSPRHATCLDLALTLAAACLHAGLHPYVLLVDSPEPGGPAHALLAVRVDDPDGDDPDEPAPPDADVWHEAPADWDDLVQSDVAGPARPLIVLDPVGVARALPTSPITGTDASFDAAVRAGSRYAEGWSWRLAVDIGRLWRSRDTHTPAVPPAHDPLQPPYLPLVPEVHRPLQMLWPEYQVVPFQARDELTVLLDWCLAVADGPYTGIAVLHGVGGAGKTRLAREVAHRLARDHGWYAGYLRTESSGPDWLGVVTSPTLVVLDYADARGPEARRLFGVLRRRAERGAAPAVVLMTARSTDGQWLSDLRRAWNKDGLLCRERDVHLPAEHPDGGTLARRAFDAFRSSGDAIGLDRAADAAPRDWTTLDRLLLAFLAARTPDRERLPTTRAELYDEILEHEHSYWKQVHAAGAPVDGVDVRVLNRATTCLTLRTPVDPEEAFEALCTVRELARDAQWAERVRVTLTTCLSPAPGEPLALRPDPIADHLVLRTLRQDAGLLPAVLTGLDDDRATNALRQLNRAAWTDRDAAADMMTRWAAAGAGGPHWRPVLAVASEQGGAALDALDRLVDTAPEAEWLDELAEGIPFGATGLPRLGLKAEQRRFARLHAESAADPARSARLLDRLGHRHANLGNVGEALRATTGAVDLHRRLAGADPLVHLPGLANALGTLANLRSRAGDRAGALASAREAASHYRRLAQVLPAVFRPDLASALNGLSAEQNHTGDRAGALASAAEAVDLLRELARTDRAAFLHHLAMAVNNLGVHQLATGDRAGFLESVTEAVAHFRELTAADPTAYRHELASALSNLSVQQAGAGDRSDALRSITEAVALHRRLADLNPGVFRSDLADSLVNLSSHKEDAGDVPGALAAAAEAVAHYRALAVDTPAAVLPRLAKGLNNLAIMQAASGQPGEAFGTITEAVAHFRALAADEPAAYLHDLANGLINLAGQQADLKRTAEALDSLTEAVGHYRRLARTARAAHLPDLATALHNLSISQAAAGANAQALDSVTEAVGIRRELAENEDGFYPALATSLLGLADRRAAVGDPDGALEAAREGVLVRRALAQVDPAGYTSALAAALYDCSEQQSRAGDADGALESVSEALTIRMSLAESDPAPHQADLARTFHAISDLLAETGNRIAARNAAAEAVRIRRGLAETDPGTHLPPLAAALNNLANRELEQEDHAAALEAAAEAVELLRGLAGTDPDDHLFGLATALHTLSWPRLDAGDQDGALAAITEAAGHFRRLAETDPGRHLDRLATTLGTLATVQSQTGNPTGALETMGEAVELTRHLFGLAPGTYLPGLASALNNLAARQSAAGDRSGALASAGEAVAHYTVLARADPAVHLDGLGKALKNFSKQQTEDGPFHTAWSSAAAALSGDPLAQAELNAWYAHGTALRGDRERAVALLRSAAAGAESEDLELRSRARKLVRQVAVDLEIRDETLPGWATAPFAPDTAGLISAWATRSGWPDEEEFLRAHAGRLTGPEGREQLRLFAELSPLEGLLTDLVETLDTIDAHGLTDVIDAGRRHHEAVTLLQSWLDTPDWSADQAFHASHWDQLHDPYVSSVLASGEDPDSQQHFAVLRLAGRVPLDTVYEVVTDAEAARDQALQALEASDIDALDAIIGCNRGVAETPSGPQFLLVILIASDDADLARRLAPVIVKGSTPLQCEAFAIHLRNLARRLPDLAPLAEELAGVIHPPADRT
ncbi:hypothetical protein [Kitasatospora sp. NPDC056184]|uniref:hypothetical protein n=1 Tax=Kitasatospora sp. NPDC056184 TaxID=3345738 RepID=UPI0035DF6952